MAATWRACRKPQGVPVLSVRADVRRFDSPPGEYALIDVVWSITLSGEQPRSLTCGSHLRVPSQASLASVVLAHQQAIGQLAEAIAGSGRALANAPQAGCPR
ncbi:ABC-type transport auxiliary lipoprotein family protein [Pseudomonas sp. KNUC1026]|uniref:ABC-type transport auxiliary lipoprotein family protein n=1 Tax=Pseudomonas sp. KNUC1026 TaxID=2893890 RepID=UPI003FA7C0F2